MEIIHEGIAGLLKSRPGYHYPNFRLPRDYQNLIGEEYKIFTTSFKGAQAFLLVFPDIPSSDKESFTIGCKTEGDPKLDMIEKSLNEIKDLLTSNNNPEINNDSKEEWAQPDSNRRPPPCKGGVITN